MGHVVEVCPQRGVTRWIIALFVLGVIAAPCAWAADTVTEDLQQRLKILKKDIETHRKAKSFRALREAVKEAEKLYADAAEDDAVRGAVVDIVGRLTKVKGDENIVIVGLHGLGDLGDPRGAKYVRGKLRQPNVKESSNVLQAAVATAADVVDASLVAPLLKIVTKSKTYGIAADAIQSLGRYGRIEKQRTRILRAVVESVRKDRAGGVSGGGAGGGARGGSGGTSTNPDQGPLPPAKGGSTSNRWTALARVLPGAMNELTGQDIGHVDDWIDLVRENRGHLDQLFRDDPK